MLLVANHRQLAPSDDEARSVTLPLPQLEPGVTVGMAGVVPEVTVCVAMSVHPFKVAVTE